MSLAAVVSLWLASATPEVATATSTATAPVIAPAASMAEPLAARWQRCRALSDSLRRLVCYDAMVDLAAPAAAPVTHSAAWTSIARLEAKRRSDSPAFLLHSDDEPGALTLTRPAAQGAMLAISCADHITRIRVRLENPWAGREVVSQLDHRMPRQDNWFIRDGGFLLESGRGLPAIEMLKSWIGYQQLELQGAAGPLRVELDGLQEALKPLRQQCRW